MNIRLRPFTKEDIPSKIRWVNDPSVNRFLHYQLPLEYEKTLSWFHALADRTDREDLVIEADGTAVGTIGLLSINRSVRSAEFYIMLGEQSGKGIALEASKLLMKRAFCEKHLHRLYLYTETENIRAQRLVEKLGFQKEGCLRDELIRSDKYVSRFLYSMLKEEYDEFFEAHSADADLLPRRGSE